MSPKIVGFPQIIHLFIGFFHDFHHPFGGYSTPIFGKIHIAVSSSIDPKYQQDIPGLNTPEAKAWNPMGFTM